MLESKEVSCQMITPILRIAQNDKLETSKLLQGTDLNIETLKNTQNRISWDQLSIIMNNLTDWLGYSKTDLIHMGEQIKDTPQYKPLFLLFRFLFTLPEFYEWMHRPSSESPTRQAISCISYEISSDADNNYRLKFKLAEGYKPIWQFYYTSMGVIRILPTIYGLPPVDVNIFEQEDGCLYHFQVPKTGGWLSGIRKLIMSPFVAKSAARSLTLVNAELFDTNVKLQEENKRLIETQAALEVSRQQAEEASKAKSQFLANISHELRTPLNGIIGSMSLLIEDEKNKERLESLKIVNESSELLLNMLNEVLDFSKIESGNFNINSAPFNPSEIQSEIFGSFLPIANKKNITLNSTCHIDPQNYLLGDALKIKQILNNLISNAIKFCDQGDVAITSYWQADKNMLVLTVSDSGIGIPEDKQSLIFSEFVQLDSSLKRKHEGAGLGLAITNRLINKMDGSIEVASKVGEGSTFTVTIPLQPAQAPKVVLENEPEESDTTLNILLVEDNKTNQLVITRLIKKTGHQPVLAENGLECLEKIKHDQFDLILMDIMMPEMDGIEATREIRKTFSKNTLPILALSANTEAVNIEECLAVGMNEYLHKPIRMQELKSILNRYAPKLTAAESS